VLNFLVFPSFQCGVVSRVVCFELVCWMLQITRRSPKEILEYVFRQVVNFKKLNPDTAAPAEVGGNGVPNYWCGVLYEAGCADLAECTETIDLARTSRATNIADVYANDLSAPLAGPAGLGAGIGAGFHSSTAPQFKK
jgi:hypothetical protein